MALQRWAPIDSPASLLKALEDSLGYCDCAYDDTPTFLREFLRAAADRSDTTNEPERFREASERLVAFLKAGGSSGMRSWFVYLMDRADLVSHNFNLYDVWITDRGRWLLAGLEQFP